MKRILAFVMALVLCLGLCACAGSVAGGADLSAQEKRLLGSWSDGEYDYFTLLSSGAVLCDYSLAEATDENDVYYGHWEVEDGFLILYPEKDNEAMVYKIVDNNTLMHKGCPYTRQ